MRVFIGKIFSRTSFFWFYNYGCIKVSGGKTKLTFRNIKFLETENLILMILHGCIVLNNSSAHERGQMRNSIDLSCPMHFFFAETVNAMCCLFDWLFRSHGCKNKHHCSPRRLCIHIFQHKWVSTNHFQLMAQLQQKLRIKQRQIYRIIWIAYAMDD